ncbi:sushi repeat-containing protein SRPX2 [Aplochiton taeniatus]
MNPQWCHYLSLANGEVTCFSPRGRNYRSTLGTRCQMTCDRGYRLLGKTSLQCMPNRRWSGTAYCRQIRCHVLPLIFQGTYSCTRGFVVDSRCDYSCYHGYQIEGGNSRICLDGGSWSGTEPTCADHDPPKIKCPLSRLKVAEPGKLTARVSWDPPVATDTADKSPDVILVGQGPNTTFNEGINIVRYKVYDQAKNRGTCKFIVRVEVKRCPALQTSLHGSLTCSSDGNNYGAECKYHCDGGYERRGSAHRVCQLNGSWSDDPAECVAMLFKTDVKTSSALLDQFYEKRRLLIVSTPSLEDSDYKFQNLMIQKSACGLDLRQVTVIELIGSPSGERGLISGKQLDGEVIEGLRRALRISKSYFNMVLLDEHGSDRERFITTVTSDELFSYIDDYVLNEEERDRLELHRDVCG